MKRVRFIYTVLIIVLLLSACQGAGAPAAEHSPLKVGWIAWGGFYPLILGHEKGIFEKHGVAVEPVYYEVYTAGLSDMQTAILDGMTMSMGDAVLIEGQSAGGVRFPLLTNIAMEAEAVVAVPDIATADNLKGKKIGCSLGTYGELFVRRVLAANNIGIGEVELVNLPIESLPDALAEGSVQAGHVWEPTLSEAIRGGNHVLYLASEFPGLITDGVAFRTQVVQERPEDLRAFIAAWFETLEWWQANTDEAARIIATHTGLSVDEVSTAGINLLDQQENLAAFQPGNDTSSVYFTAGLYRDFYIDVGVVSTAPDVEKMLTPSFLK